MPLIDLNGLGHFKDKENAMIAEDFSASKAYAAGDYCYYNGTLYKFKTAHAAGAWTTTDVEEAKLADDVSGLKESTNDLKTAINQKVDKYREVEITDISLDKFEIVPTYYTITTYANTPAVQFSSFSASGKSWIWSKLKNDYSDVYFKVHYGMFNASNPNTRLVLAANETNVLAILLNATSSNAYKHSDSALYNATAYSRNTNCRDIAADDTLHCVKDGSKVAVYLVDNGAEVPLFANEFIDVLSFWASANFTEDEIGFGLVSNNSARGEALLYDFTATVGIGEDFITRDEAMEEINAIKQSEIAKNLYLKKDLLDKTTMQSGYIDSSGNLHSGSGLLCTDFIPVESGYVYCNGDVVYSQYFAFYNEDKSFNASYSTLGAMTSYPNTSLMFYIAVPENAKYFRCTYSASSISDADNWISQTPERPYPEDFYSIDKVYPETMNPTNPCEYSELSIRAFHKIACIGDSITYGGMNYTVPTGGVSPVNTDLSAWYSYPTKLKAITGVETTNFGVSGLDSVQWYDQFKDTDFSGYDAAIIHLGINDSAHQVTDADTTEAIGNIITMLKTASKDIRIFVCNVIAAYDGTGYQAKGNLIMNYAASLDDPYVIPLDLAAYSHVRPETSYVAGHLTALGYYMMAYDLARYISWYIDQNKRDFRFIQFIGTDAVYP